MGSAGIGLKYDIESVTGNLYPSMNRSTHSKVVYALRQRCLARYARKRGIPFTEEQRNQRTILENNPSYKELHEKLTNSISSGGNNFEHASNHLNRARGIPLANSTPAPETSHQPDLHDTYTLSPGSPEDIFADMDLFNQLGNTNIMDVFDNGEVSNKTGGGGQTIGGSPSVMGQSPALQILQNPSIAVNTFKIRHFHLLQTWGFKFHLYSQDGAKKFFLLHYPLALVAVDFLPFYLSPIEF